MSAQVLLADDDVELSGMLREYLEREGFGVTAVHDGEAAARLALSGSYQIVVLDVMMPKVDGIEALRQIRQTSRVPVIMLTARGDDVDRIVVHLSSIRQKLGDGARLIRTVRGLGYHLVKD